MAECGLLNLATCIPQKFFEFLTNLLNAPISPLLSFTKSLLINPVNTEILIPLWAIIIYVLSLFYGLLMLYSGFNFMFSGQNAIKRAKAKNWFVNIFIMIVLIQASYFLYSLILDVQSLLTLGIMDLINPNFFLLTIDNLTNMGLQFAFVFVYLITMLFTVLLLTFRYIIVCSGIVFFPIGIFCYFIPALKDYGKLIFNFLGICIFIVFFNAIIFLVCSKIIEIGLFANFKIVVTITAFGISNILMFYLMFFSAIKSGVKTINESASIVSALKYFI